MHHMPVYVFRSSDRVLAHFVKALQNPVGARDIPSTFEAYVSLQSLIKTFGRVI